MSAIAAIVTPARVGARARLSTAILPIAPNQRGSQRVKGRTTHPTIGIAMTIEDANHSVDPKFPQEMDFSRSSAKNAPTLANTRTSQQTIRRDAGYGAGTDCSWPSVSSGSARDILRAGVHDAAIATATPKKAMS